MNSKKKNNLSDFEFNQELDLKNGETYYYYYDVDDHHKINLQEPFEDKKKFNFLTYQ